MRQPEHPVLVRELSGQQAIVVSLTYSPDSRTLVSQILLSRLRITSRPARNILICVPPSAARSQNPAAIKGQGADPATPNHGDHGPYKPYIDRLRSPTDTGKAVI